MKVPADAPITAAMFHRAVGSKPDQDELERVNCQKAGEELHSQCGWNYEANAPVFIAGPDNVSKEK